MMMLLEQVRPRPQWMAALEVALTRPPGVPERRAGEDPWAAPTVARPQRITDDLAWLRRAMDDPLAAGFKPLDDEDPQLRAWEITDYALTAKLTRLLERGVLEAAGFALHAEDLPRTA